MTPPITIRSKVAYVRDDSVPGTAQQLEIDIRLIGVRIPADWASKQYVPLVIPDPDDPTKPVLEFVDLASLIALGGTGWGYYGTYIMGTL